MPLTGAVAVTVLGSGTSVGVPMIGCSCAVCTSADPRDQRLRPSVLFEFNGCRVLIDVTPDFRQQALRHRFTKLDAVLFTHAHADHILGIDDLRPFNFRQSGPLPIYGSGETLDTIRRVFDYAFRQGQPQGPVPRLECHTLTGQPFELCGATVIPVDLRHGEGSVTGFRVGSVAYLTDHSEIPGASLTLLEDLDILFLDALRYKPHPKHNTVEESLRYVERLKPRQTFFTHISHDLGHARAEQLLPPHVRLAYDGMTVSA
ncbi:MAG: MBL fold metallo-hydrolase [Acidobacteria bacterium]|nr:MBL fold metallo-hydrolase [Acidobacteriota bacterium]